MILLKIKLQHGIGVVESGDMKINDIIVEADSSKASAKKPPKRFQDATRGLHSFGLDSNSTYEMYRVMLAAAASNGRDDVPDFVDAESWIGRQGVATPYTQEEHDMLKKAYKKVGTKYADLNKNNLRSMELPLVNKASPVAKRKTNKYGV